MSNEIPRRVRIDLFVPAEKAIYDAVQSVEAMPPDVRLTRAVNKLGEAQALVADFVDGVPDGEGYPRPAETLNDEDRDVSCIVIGGIGRTCGRGLRGCPLHHVPTEPGSGAGQ